MLCQLSEGIYTNDDCQTSESSGPYDDLANTLSNKPVLMLLNG